MSSKPKRTINNLKQRQRLLQIGMFSLVTIMIWMAFSLIRTQKRTSIDPILRQMALPLKPTLDTELIDKLETKRQFTATELADFPIYKFLLSKQSGTERVVTIDVEEEEEPTRTPNPVSTPLPASASATSLPATSSAQPLEVEI